MDTKLIAVRAFRSEVDRLHDTQEATGSTPVTPTMDAKSTGCGRVADNYVQVSSILTASTKPVYVNGRQHAF